MGATWEAALASKYPGKGACSYSLRDSYGSSCCVWVTKHSLVFPVVQRPGLPQEFQQRLAAEGNKSLAAPVQHPGVLKDWADSFRRRANMSSIAA